MINRRTYGIERMSNGDCQKVRLVEAPRETRSALTKVTIVHETVASCLFWSRLVHGHLACFVRFAFPRETISQLFVFILIGGQPGNCQATFC